MLIVGVIKIWFQLKTRGHYFKTSILVLCTSSSPSLTDLTTSPSLQQDTPCSNHSGLATIFHTPVTCRVQPASSGNRQVVLLLQQQQAAIKQVLDGQKAFESWQSHIEKELSDLQEKVDSKLSSCSGVDLKTQMENESE